MKIKNLTLALGIVLISIGSTKAASPIQLNLEKDKNYKILSYTEQTISQSMNGMDMEISMKNTNLISFNIVSKEMEYMMAKVSFDSMVNEMDMPGRSMVMSSAKPGDPTKQDEAMNTAFYILSQNPLDVKISYSGRIIEISNANAVCEKMYKSLDSLTQAAQMQMRPMLEASLNTASLKSMIEMIISYLPENTNATAWDSKTTISASGMNLDILSKYKVKEQIGNDITLTYEATIEPSGDGTATMNGMKMTFDLRGLGNGELTLDAATGWIIKGKAKQRMKGSITANGMNIPMEVNSKTEFKTVQ